ncbi:hypothetical protein [Saliphagus sp. LR7]|uniref:hypothetical protein n=1 Tax=Saliphagus sp. LR7 TaxID=2282654 RepID=UPI003742B2CB
MNSPDTQHIAILSHFYNEGEVRKSDLINYGREEDLLLMTYYLYSYLKVTLGLVLHTECGFTRVTPHSRSDEITCRFNFSVVVSCTGFPARSFTRASRLLSDDYISVSDGNQQIAHRCCE